MRNNLKLRTALLCAISMTISQAWAVNVYATDIIQFVEEEGTDDTTIDLSAPGSVDIEKDEVMENASSLTTEINVEVPQSIHIDPTLTINRGVYADDIELSGLTYKIKLLCTIYRLLNFHSRGNKFSVGSTQK